ncbi:MAG: biotin synthase BioB [Desulfarculus sp.]|nr:biotin synthase BioB [Desulfarculus sp.]
MPEIPLPLTDLDQAARLLEPASLAELGELMAQAGRARQAVHGDTVELCAIVNARSGRCSEDCAFCAQSAHHQTRAEVYPLLSADEILARSRAAAAAGATRFGIVTSGRGCPEGPALDEICRAVEAIRREGRISPCGSLGLLRADQARRLADAGLTRYHHNLEAGPSHFPRICASHAFEDRVETVRLAQDAGLEVCVGGIVGLGESPRERAELALATARLNPESVPLNFLNPIPGTRLGHLPRLTPLQALAAVAVFRLMLPAKARLRTCGGRQQVLGPLAPLMYLAGADATMIGNYLTTEGRQPADDLADLAALGLRPMGREI